MKTDVVTKLRAGASLRTQKTAAAEIERLRPEMEKRLSRLGTIPGVGPALDYTQGIIEAMLSTEVAVK